MNNSTELQRFENVYETYKSGDYEGATFLLRRLAKEGDYDACMVLGTIYESGKPGVPKNEEEALKWYKKAISGSNQPQAYFYYARMCYYGLGTKKDDIAALESLLKIEHEQQPGVQFFLGLIYCKTKTSKRDLLKAESYFRAAIDNGHIAAMYSLGRLMIKTWRIKEGIKTLLETYRQSKKINSTDDWRVNLRWVVRDEEEER